MTLFNPQIHHRRSLRLNGYDYSLAGLYFITICCHDKICRFGNVVNNEMVLNEYGKVAYEEWLKLSERFSNFELDVFQIMPNHMHGIVWLTDVGATLAVAQTRAGASPAPTVAQPHTVAQNRAGASRAGASPAPTVCDIVGAYKSLVANRCLDIYKSKNEMMGKLWQRNYYEHIIRNDFAYERISEYIIQNPLKWMDDIYFYSDT